MKARGSSVGLLRVKHQYLAYSRRGGLRPGTLPPVAGGSAGLSASLVLGGLLVELIMLSSSMSASLVGII